MRITTVILRVTDLDRAIDFWSEVVGLDVSRSVESFAFLEGGGVQLALNEVDGLELDTSLTEIVFELDDVRSEYDEMARRGVPFEVELRPVTEMGGRRLLAAHFRDPDGHVASVSGWV